ncbi:MAG TPA: hypothetical protein VHZ95_12180, partial [Polyangiales bacterium]|nr:hypothetical protein [Polyangiales bacterium]
MALLATLAVVAHGDAVHAQTKHPSAVLFSTASAPKGSPLDSVLQSSLDDLDVVEVVARPGMDLGAVQLALDCVSETAQCLRAAADQNGADVLIAPTLQRTGAELVLSVLRFDSRSGSMRRVARRQAGQIVGAELLDNIPNMLRELFDLPQLTKQDAPPPTAATAPAESTVKPDVDILPEAPMEPPAWQVPVAPFILAGAG